MERFGIEESGLEEERRKCAVTRASIARGAMESPGPSTRCTTSVLVHAEVSCQVTVALFPSKVVGAVACGARVCRPMGIVGSAAHGPSDKRRRALRSGWIGALVRAALEGPDLGVTCCALFVARVCANALKSVTVNGGNPWERGDHVGTTGSDGDAMIDGCGYKV